MATPLERFENIIQEKRTGIAPQEEQPLNVASVAPQAVAPTTLSKSEPAFNIPDFKTALRGREVSNNDYSTIGGSNDAYSGAYQMGLKALQDVGLIKPGATSVNDNSAWNIPGGRQAFLNNQKIQEEAYDSYLQKNIGYLDSKLKKHGLSFDALSSQDKAGLLGAAHLTGSGNAVNLLLNGTESKDGFGTSNAEYFKLTKDTQAIAESKSKTINANSETKRAALNIPQPEKKKVYSSIQEELDDIDDKLHAINNPSLMSDASARYDGFSRTLNTLGGVVNATADLAGGFLEIGKTINDAVSDDEEGWFDQTLNKLARTGHKIGRSTDSLYNPINSELLAEEFGKDYEASDGFIDGAWRMLKTAVSNPATAAETFMTSLPHMVGLAQSGGKGAIIFATMVGTQIEDQLEIFRESHDGREPDADEYFVMLGTAIAAVGIDKFQSKLILNQPILNKASNSKAIKSLIKATDKIKGNKVLNAVPYGKTIAKGALGAPTEALQEGSQEALTELGGLQDLSALQKDEFKKKIYTASGMGMGAGMIGGAGVQAIPDTVNTLVNTKKVLSKINNPAGNAIANNTQEKALNNIDIAIAEENPEEVLNVVTNFVDFGKLDEKGRYDNLVKAHGAIQQLNEQYGSVTSEEEADVLTSKLKDYVNIVNNLTAEHARKIDEAAGVKPEENFKNITEPLASKVANVNVANEVDIILGSSQSDEFLTEEVTDKLLASKMFNEGATNDQKNQILAINELHKNSSEVSQDIISGSKDGDFVGTKQHLARVKEGINANNPVTSEETITSLNDFLVNEKAKLTHLEKLIKSADGNKLTIPVEEQQYGIEYIDGRSGSLVKSIQKDITHIKGVLGRAANQHDQAFDSNILAKLTDLSVTDADVTVKPTANDAGIIVPPEREVNPKTAQGNKFTAATFNDFRTRSDTAVLSKRESLQARLKKLSEEENPNYRKINYVQKDLDAIEDILEYRGLIKREGTVTKPTVTKPKDSKPKDVTPKDVTPKDSKPKDSKPEDTSTDTPTDTPIDTSTESTTETDDQGRPITREYDDYESRDDDGEPNIDLGVYENSPIRTLDEAKEEVKGTLEKDNSESLTLYNAGVAAAKTALITLSNIFSIPLPNLTSLTVKEGEKVNGYAIPETNTIALSPQTFISMGIGETTSQSRSQKEILSSLAAFETLYHEFGHILEGAVIEKASNAEQAAILAEYEKWVAQSDTVNRNSTATLVLAGGIPHINVDGKLVPLSEHDPEYWTSYKEWLADQVARYITTKQVEGSPEFVSFIQRFAKTITRLYKAFHKLVLNGTPVGDGKAVIPLTEFLDNYIENAGNAPSTGNKPTTVTKPTVTKPTDGKPRTIEIEDTNQGTPEEPSRKVVLFTTADGTEVLANAEQIRAMDAIGKFLDEPATDSREFTLNGRGGTGKTTIIAKAIELSGKTASMYAPTNKAAAVLKDASGKNVNTVSKGTGVIKLNDTAQSNARFKIRDSKIKAALAEITKMRREEGQDAPIYPGVIMVGKEVIIIDEASMLSADARKTILDLVQRADPENTYNTKIIYMGDNVQLPPIPNNSKDPVVNSPVFDVKNSATLRRRMRQKDDSPIPGLTDKIANNVEKEEGAERVVLGSDDRVSNFDDKANEGVIFTQPTAMWDQWKKDFLANSLLTRLLTYNNNKHDKTDGDTGEKHLSVKILNELARKVLFGDSAKNELNKGENIVLTQPAKGATLDSEKDFRVNGIKKLETYTELQVEEISETKVASTRIETMVYNEIEDEFEEEIIELPTSIPVEVYEVRVRDKDKYLNITIPTEAGKAALEIIYQQLAKDKQFAKLGKIREHFVDYQYAYAVNSHIAQGSTYRNVYVIEDNIIGDTNPSTNKVKNQALYTAMSRASNKLVMVSKLNSVDEQTLTNFDNQSSHLTNKENENTDLNTEERLKGVTRKNIDEKITEAEKEASDLDRKGKSFIGDRLSMQFYSEREGKWIKFGGNISAYADGIFKRKNADGKTFDVDVEGVTDSYIKDFVKEYAAIQSKLAALIKQKEYYDSTPATESESTLDDETDAVTTDTNAGNGTSTTTTTTTEITEDPIEDIVEDSDTTTTESPVDSTVGLGAALLNNTKLDNVSNIKQFFKVSKKKLTGILSEVPNLFTALFTETTVGKTMLEYLGITDTQAQEIESLKVFVQAFHEAAAKGGIWNLVTKEKIIASTATPDQLQDKIDARIQKAKNENRDLYDSENKNIARWEALKEEREKPTAKFTRGDLDNDPMGLFIVEDAKGNRSVNENLLSLIGMISYEWLATEGADTLRNEDTTINLLLGRPKEAYIPEFLAKKYRHVGITRSRLADKLGAMIFAQTGLELDTNTADGFKLSQMKQTLGDFAISVMLEHNVLNQREEDLSRNDEGDSYNYILENRDSSEENKSTTFPTRLIRVKTNDLESESTRGNEPYNQTKNGYSKVKDILDKILHTRESSIRAPGFKPVAVNRDMTVKGTRLKVPEATLDTLEKMHKTEFGLKQNFYNFFLAMTKDGLDDMNEMLGVKEDYKDTEQVTTHDSWEGKNNGIKRDIENLSNFIEDNVENMFDSIFFSYSVVGNHRIHDRSNTISMQNSLLHRHAFGAKKWEVEVNTKDERSAFALAVGLAFGEKVDNQRLDITIAEVNKYMKRSSKKGKIIVPAVDAVKKINNKEPLTKEDISAIKAAVALGDNPAHTMDGLLALAVYDKNAPFTTNLALETDGKTNGVITGMLQSLLEKDAMNKLAAGGMFVDNPINDYGEWLEGEGNTDVYTELGVLWQGILEDDFLDDPKVYAINSMLSETVQNNTIISMIAREFTKNPVMISNYGAGVRKVMKEFSEEVIAKIYTKINENRDNPEAMAILQEQIRILSGDSTLTIPMGKGAQSFRFNKNTRLNIKNSITETYGDALGQAITKQFEGFKEFRDLLNNGLNYAFIAFYEVYKTKLEEAEKANNNRNLTDEQREDLAYELLELMPVFNGPLSDKMDEGLIAMDTIKATLYSESHDTQQSYSKKINNTNSNSSKGHVRYVDYVDGGVSGLIKAIQSIDSATIQGVLNKYDMLNMFDAGYYSLQEAIQATQDINQEYWDVNKKYSILDAVKESVERTLTLVSNDERYTESYAAIGTGIYEYANRFELAKEEEDIDWSKVDNAPIATLFTDLTNLKERVDQNRDSLFSGKRTVYSGNYVIPGGSKLVSERAPAKPQAQQIVEDTVITEAIENIISDVLSSSDEAISPDDFKNIGSEPSGPSHTLDIFDRLSKVGNVQETSEHKDHLRSLIDNIVNRALGPLELRRREEGSETKGLIDVNAGFIYLKTATQTAKTFSNMSAQETYGHELVHGVTKAGIDDNFNYSSHLARIFNAAQEQITWEDFLQKDGDGNPIYKTDQATEEEAAKARYNYIFNNDTIITNEREHSVSGHIITNKVNPALYEFMAFGLTNAKVNELLSGVTIQPDRKARPQSVLRLIEDLYHRIMDHITGKIYLSKAVTADVALMELADRMTTIHESKRSVLLNNLPNFEFNKKFTEALTAYIFKPLDNFATKVHDRNPDGILSNTIYAPVKFAKYAKSEEFHKILKIMRKNIGLAEKGFFMTTIREIAGRTKNNAIYHHLLTASKHYVDQLRQKMQEHTTAQMMAEFKSDTAVSEDESVGILRTLMEADMEVLWDKFGLSGLAELLTDQTKLNVEIKKIKDELRKSTAGKYYIAQSRGLGQLMALGKTRNEGDQQLNAYKIATLTNVSNRDTLAESTVTRQIELIDQLASLFAIDNTSVYYRTQTANVIGREQKADSNENGITFVLGMSREFKKESLGELFENDKMQMIKGYTAETYNPAVSIQVINANDKEGIEALEAKNYEFRESLGKDQNDVVDSEQLLYVSTDSALNPRVKGIFSMTNELLKGFTLYDQYLAKGDKKAKLKAIIAKNAIQKKKQTFVNRQFDNEDATRYGSFDTLVPVTNENGQTTDYRYMMSKESKVEILQKDQRFERVMGRMYANKVDKVNSRKINTKTIQAAYDDFRSNVESNPTDFIEVGKKTKDRENRELYDLLPTQAKKDIKEIWGEDRMFFRESELRTAFGFRKWSLADIADIKQVEYAFDSIGAKSSYVHIAKTMEAYWQGFVGVAKDFIVVKLYSTVMNNMISNNIILAMKMGASENFFKNQVLAYRALDKYLADEGVLKTYQNKLKVGYDLSDTQKKNLSRKIAQMEDTLTKNPVKRLLDEGVFQTISAEELELGDDIYSPRNKVIDKIQPVIDMAVPEGLQTGYKWAYMTHGTPPYKFMLKMTQYSDFIARYTLYQHRMKDVAAKDFDIAHEAALDEIKDTFINYDIPTSTGLQYMNDMGLLLFTKFPLRIFKVFLNMLIDKPASYAALYAAEGLVGDLPDIGDSSPLNIITNGFNSPFEIFNSGTDIAWDDLVRAGI